MVSWCVWSRGDDEEYDARGHESYDGNVAVNVEGVTDPLFNRNIDELNSGWQGHTQCGRRSQDVRGLNSHWMYDLLRWLPDHGEEPRYAQEYGKQHEEHGPGAADQNGHQPGSGDSRLLQQLKTHPG